MGGSLDKASLYAIPIPTTSGITPGNFEMLSRLNGLELCGFVKTE